MCLSHVHMFTCVWCCWRMSLTTSCSTPMIGWLCKDFVTLTTSLLELLWSDIGQWLSINSKEVLGNTVFQVTDQEKTVFSSLHRPIFCFVGLFNQGCQIYYKSRGKEKKSGWPKLGFKNQKTVFDCKYPTINQSHLVPFSVWDPNIGFTRATYS